MTTKISPREWEAISAYLDGQLAQKERSRLESRMQSRPELRAALEDMRRTRTILRSQTRLRAPRNFTLTPQMAGVKSRPRSYPALRLASALASVVLVLVLIGDFFSGAPAVIQAPSAAMPQQQAYSKTAAEGAAHDQALETSVAMEAPATTGRNMGAAPALEMTPTPEVSGLMNENALPTQAAAAAAEPLKSTSQVESSQVSGEVASPLPESTLAPQATSLPPATAEALVAQAPLPTATVEILTNQATSQPPALNKATENGSQPATPFIKRSALRTLEIFLALIALSTGLLAFFMRRSANH